MRNASLHRERDRGRDRDRHRGVADRGHWPETLIEAALLGLFMISACVVTVLVEHPALPLRASLAWPLGRRALIGAAMGVTAVALIQSPWGRRSGAHFNPAVTLAFLRLGRITRADATGYVLAHCVGGILGVQVAALALGRLVAHPAIAFVATVPGEAGAGPAFLGELGISFVTMSVVLILSGGHGARYTGLACGALVAVYITVESPLSGMSMNPARSLASAVGSGSWSGFWIYCTAPVLGMLGAAEVFGRPRGVPERSRAPVQPHDSRMRSLLCRHRTSEAA